MSLRKSFRYRAAALLVLVAGPAAVPAFAGTAAFVSAHDTMMIALAPDSARSSLTVRRTYQEHLDLLVLNGYTDIEGALDNGGLVPLPADPARFNLSPRLEGLHPIGEKDIANQASYIAARPATIGMLIEIARRVKSGPLEITSLVRHGEYQDALRATNTNANTSVPMHTMGLAVDIALVNSSLETAYEVRDVLLAMQQKGDILFVGERRQLVFHVVPAPARLGYFTDVYIRKVGLPPTSQSAHVFAKGPAAKKGRARGVATVTTEVLAVQPVEEATGVGELGGVVPGPRSLSSSASVLEKAAITAGTAFERGFLLLAALLLATWRIAARPSVRPRLFDFHS